MATTLSSGQILKADSLARVRTPPDRRRELLDELIEVSVWPQAVKK